LSKLLNQEDALGAPCLAVSSALCEAPAVRKDPAQSDIHQFWWRLHGKKRFGARPNSAGMTRRH
jgi:hypothetical protein